VYYLSRAGSHHHNLLQYWRKNSYQFQDTDFWSWVKDTHGADLDRKANPVRWQFKTQQELLCFALKWT
jgi:hypothetical protein